MCRYQYLRCLSSVDQTGVSAIEVIHVLAYLLAVSVKKEGLDENEMLKIATRNGEVLQLIEGHL